MANKKNTDFQFELDNSYELYKKQQGLKLKLTF